MIEDPWVHLISKNSDDITDESYEQQNSLSDSLRPQLGDSFINPAPEVPDDLNNTADLSKYSFNPGHPEGGVSEENSSVSVLDDGYDNAKKKIVSESMIALVDDSLLERNTQDLE